MTARAAPSDVIARRAGRATLGAVAVALATLAAPRAGADTTKEQCVKENADAQALRIDGKLAGARALLEACGDATCPALVRDDCAQRLNEIDRVQPAIIFDVRDATGADVSGVSVAVDGAPPQKLRGLALRIDPGEHELTFSAPDRGPLTRRFVVKEGEKERRERIVFAESRPPVASPAPASAAAASTTPMRPERVVALAIGGAGIAGLALGSVFGALTLSTVSDQNAACASSTQCPDHAKAVSDHSAAATDAVLSTVAFVAGSALLVGGVALFLVTPNRSASSAASARPPSWALAPSAGPGAAGLFLHGTF